MNKFPEFMRQASNRISSKDRYTPGIEGYVYEGIDGSQITIWTSQNGGEAAEHVHEYDEYMVVIQGQYTLIIGGKNILLLAGQEYHIPKGIPHGGKSTPGTRTINAFGGKRAKRESEDQ